MLSSLRVVQCVWIIGLDLDETLANIPAILNQINTYNGNNKATVELVAYWTLSLCKSQLFPLTDPCIAQVLRCHMARDQCNLWNSSFPFFEQARTNAFDERGLFLMKTYSVSGSWEKWDFVAKLWTLKNKQYDRIEKRRKKKKNWAWTQRTVSALYSKGNEKNTCLKRCQFLLHKCQAVLHMWHISYSVCDYTCGCVHRLAPQNVDAEIPLQQPVCFFLS